MREIKFRAKSLDGIWEYGDLHLHCKHPYIHNLNGAKIYIDENTVGQFTGLHDKNGKEIYEGDILRKSTYVEDDLTETYLDRDTVGVVRILPSCGTTICNCIVYETDDPCEEKEMKERIIERAQVIGKRSEIIGNVYDNFDLLKGGNV